MSKENSERFPRGGQLAALKNMKGIGMSMKEILIVIANFFILS